MEKQIIFTDKAPAPSEVFSQAVKYGDLLFISGQAAVDPKTQKFAGGGIREQARLCLSNLKNIVEQGGFSMQKALKVTVYLENINEISDFNEIYKDFFSEKPPARTVIAASMLAGRKCVVDAIMGK